MRRRSTRQPLRACCPSTLAEFPRVIAARLPIRDRRTRNNAALNGRGGPGQSVGGRERLSTDSLMRNPELHEPARLDNDGLPGLTRGWRRFAVPRHTPGGVASPTHGVRCPAGGDSWHDLVLGVSLVLTPGAAFSHQTAAQLFDLPLPPGFKDMQPIHVTVPLDVSRGRRKMVTWHRAGITGRVTLVGGLPVTDAARTWLDLGPHLSLPQLVAVTDRILGRRLCRELPVPRRTRAATRLRQAVHLADPRSRSPKESELRAELMLAGLPRPEVNFDIICQGEWVGCGDLVWPEYRLYVEYDGGHHADPGQRHQDAQTRNRLAQLGWRVRVVTSAMRVHDVIEMITEDLKAAGWRGSLPAAPA